VFAVRTEVLKQLLSDPEWLCKLEKAISAAEVEHVLREFCEVKGFKIVQLEKE